MRTLVSSLIIGVAASLIFYGVVFAQPVTATTLPEASDPKPTANQDEQGQNNDDQSRAGVNEDQEGIALILSSPLPSFRTQS